MDENAPIRQGFICPMCMEDLGDLDRLHQHVDSVHTTDSNSETINLIKGVFAKAKLKLNDFDFSRGIAGSSDPKSPSSSTAYNNEFVLNAPQVLGVTNSHTDYFNTTQREHTVISTEHTNTLILRLDKLLHEFTLASANRKDFEKRTVYWAIDSDFANCKVCNLKFSLTKRKHHCRLCGKIICATCSKFLSFKSAQKITSYVSMPTDLDAKAIEANENYLRVCALCKEHLQRYELRRDLNTVSSVFVDLYAKLCMLLIQINNLAPSYRRMANSLRQGESLYTLDSAIQLRKKIVYIQSEISNLSERIEKWGLDGDPIAPKKPTPREMIVQRNIRVWAITSLQDVITNMPDIPNEEEYIQLHQIHKEQVANREKTRRFYIEQVENQPNQSRRSNPGLNRTESSASDVGVESLFASLNGNQNPGLKTSASFSGLIPSDSWAPSTSQIPLIKKINPFMDNSDDEDDKDQPHPIAQQYLILKSYLKQAAQAGRQDEVLALEKSLVDCEEELEKLGIGTPRAH